MLGFFYVHEEGDQVRVPEEKSIGTLVKRDLTHPDTLLNSIGTLGVVV
jgi:hypothetical protein